MKLRVVSLKESHLRKLVIMNNKDRNVLALAYIGDAVYEVYIRDYLVKQGIEKVKKLQEEAVSYVSAKSQAKYLQTLLDKNYFNETELEVFYRARNHKSSRHPKNTDIITYKYSTGFEAIIGYNYLDGNIDRINDIIKMIIGD